MPANMKRIGSLMAFAAMFSIAYAMGRHASYSDHVELVRLRAAAARLEAARQADAKELANARELAEKRRAMIHRFSEELAYVERLHAEHGCRD